MCLLGFDATPDTLFLGYVENPAFIGVLITTSSSCSMLHHLAHSQENGMSPPSNLKKH